MTEVLTREDAQRGETIPTMVDAAMREGKALHEALERLEEKLVLVLVPREEAPQPSPADEARKVALIEQPTSAMTSAVRDVLMVIAAARERVQDMTVRAELWAVAVSAKYGRVTVEREPGNPFGEDEPVFVIRGRDALAPLALAHYAGLASSAGRGDRSRAQSERAKQVGEAVEHDIETFRRWQERNPELVKMPD